MLKLNDISPTSELGSLDLSIHAPARLMLIKLLFGAQTLEYTELMQLTDLTWGNLATHLSKLEESGYVMISKSFKGKKPNTVIRITDSGRSAYLKWGATILRAIPAQLLEALRADLMKKRKLEPIFELEEEFASMPNPDLFFLPKYHRWGMELHPIDRITQLA